MKTLILKSVVVVLTAAFISPPAWANLLNDPGFEVNPLTTALNVLNNFTTYQGQWGPEAATITGVDGGVTPAQGVKMLRMVNTGSYTQAFQVTNVTSYAALIDSGGATVNLGALFNVDKIIPAALGGISVSFFTASNYGSLTGFISGNFILDNNANTWQTISVTGTIPVGTRWLLSQAFFQDATLLGLDGNYYPGYVDAADMTVVPEPATLGLLAMGILALRRKRRFCLCYI
jgi:hypothetical protein